MTETYTVSEAAKKLDLCYMTIWTWIKEGRLAAKKVNNRYLLKESDIEIALTSGGRSRLESQIKKAASIE